MKKAALIAHCARALCFYMFVEYQPARVVFSQSAGCGLALCVVFLTPQTDLRACGTFPMSHVTQQEAGGGGHAFCVAFSY
jgi:hypothetical protein